MTCEEIRRQIPLYLYGELSFDGEEAFEQHMDGCGACRAELDREKAMHSALDASEARPSADLLERCRLELPRALRHAALADGQRRGWRSTFWGWFAPPASSVEWVAPSM